MSLEWVLGIVGGIIATVVGGLILSRILKKEDEGEAIEVWRQRGQTSTLDN